MNKYMDKFEELTGIHYPSLTDEEKSRLKEAFLLRFKLRHQAVVLTKVCGIDCEARSMTEIARELGVTHQRVQGIKSRIFRMLKHPDNKMMLLIAIGKQVKEPVKLSPYLLRKKIEDEHKELFMQLSKKAERDALCSKLKDVILTFSIEFLDLSTRSSRCCNAENITNIGELIQWSEKDLLKTPNLGTCSLREISLKLGLYGLSLRCEGSCIAESP